MANCLKGKVDRSTCEYNLRDGYQRQRSHTHTDAHTQTDAQFIVFYPVSSSATRPLPARQAQQDDTASHRPLHRPDHGSRNELQQAKINMPVKQSYTFESEPKSSQVTCIPIFSNKFRSVISSSKRTVWGKSMTNHHRGDQTKKTKSPQSRSTQLHHRILNEPESHSATSSQQVWMCSSAACLSRSLCSR